MSRTVRIGFTLAAVLVALSARVPAFAQNHAPNTYDTVPGVWAELPDGRTWGSTSAVYPAADGNIWVAERCGENTCVGHDDLDTVFLFTTGGDLVRSFGAGLIVWPPRDPRRPGRQRLDSRRARRG